MDREHLVRNTLEDRLDPLHPPALHPDVVRRTKRRRRELVTATALGGLVASTAAWAIIAAIPALENEPPRQDVGSLPATSAPSSSEPTSEDEGDAAEEECRAPACDGFDWARRVARKAGFEIEPYAGGGAPEVVKGTSHFHFWASIPRSDSGRQAVLEGEGYEQVDEIEGIPIFYDGVRVTWDIHGLFVWATRAGLEPMDPSTDALEDLIRASKEVPPP